MPAFHLPVREALPVNDDAPPTDHQAPPISGGPTKGEVRARRVLGVPKVWILPLLLPPIMISFVTTIYIGSVIDPAAHLHGLPVLIVNEDAGAASPTGQIELGASVVHALTH